MHKINKLFVVLATTLISIAGFSQSSTVVINELYGGGGNSGAIYTHDFVELYNNSSADVTMTNWTIQYTSSNGTSWGSNKTVFTGVIPANGYFLVRLASQANVGTALPGYNATGSINMSGSSGKLILTNSNVNASSVINPTDAHIVDKVGYGSAATGFETAQAPGITNSTSIQRSPIGFDSNNNATDFKTGAPSPVFSGDVTDTNPPVVTTLSPANNATEVAKSFTASINFNEPVVKRSGDILVTRTSDNSVVQTIPVSSVTVSGTTASFAVAGLSINTAYSINVPNTAFEDAAGNDFSGIASGWSFTTTAALLSSNMNSCTGSILSDGFTQYSETGTAVWACTPFGRDPNNPSGTTQFPSGVQINGFANGTNVPNVDWLISPSIDLSGTQYPLLSFWSRTAFNGLPLQLKVSTDYTGGNPSSATWTDVNGRFPAATSNTWTLSENINLAAFKGSNVHVAFVYVSDNDEGARWTLDDLRLINSATPPPATLTTSTSDVQFTYVQAGSHGDKIFTFTPNDITTDVTVHATGGFLLSKDGSNFNTSLSYTAAEANNVEQTVTVRFAPAQNDELFNGAVSISSSGLTEAISLRGSSVELSKTLEVVNWNIEWFGATDMGPGNEAVQEQNVLKIFNSAAADIYALTEIVDESRLAAVVSQMPGYSFVISNYGSHTNTAANPTSALAEAQKLAFVYKTSVFSNVSTTALLSQGINTAADLSNPAYNYYASGRFPFMLSADVTLNCVTKHVKFVLVHAKANTSPTNTSYARRKDGADTLYQTLNALYPDEHIVILGDFNDDLDKSITAGFTTTSWSAFTTDAANYTAVTLPLSLAGKKSTVSYNDVIDHVVVSNDMQAYYINGTANILNDVTGLVSNYGSTTSDHYPVFSRYYFGKPTVPPTVTDCKPSASLCTVSSGAYTLPAFSAKAYCGDVTYSYAITGATQRTGQGNDASGAFNAGTSTITWTATDMYGNTTTCQTDVTVHGNPSVLIQDAKALPSGVKENTVYMGYTPASSLNLQASVSSVTQVTYNWSNGAASGTTLVNPTSPTTYTVTVTDANGCTATAEKAIDVMDIRSGHNGDKVFICHGNKALSVAQSAVPAHLAHHDMLGSCATLVEKNRRAGDELLNETASELVVSGTPNPSPNYFTLTVSGGDETQKVQVRVTDLMGRTMAVYVNLAAKTLHIGHDYQPGVYLVEVVRGTEVKKYKLVKTAK